MAERFLCDLPLGKRSQNIINRDKKIVSGCTTRDLSIVIKDGKGCYLTDVEGRRYLDFGAGIAVMNVGHANPEVLAAVRKQANHMTHAGFADFYHELPVRFAETLVKTINHPNLNNVFLSNSGTEAVEGSYKCARWHTKKKRVIAFNGCFHGRTMGSLSMTNSKKVQRERYAPFLPVTHVPYPYWYRMKMEPEDASNFCLDKLENSMKKNNDTAALFMETIQGEGGYVVPPKSFVKGVRKLCTKYNILYCDDEVQSGGFRTGKFLAIDNFGVTPDIVSMAKSIGGGMPLGATISSRKIMDWVPGAHSNTFGGNLVSCAAGIAALNYMKKKKLGQNAHKIGKLIMKRLEEMKEQYEIIGDVRGLGLMIGIEIVKDKKSRTPSVQERDAIQCEAARKGMILLGAGKSVIRFCPPLVITKQEAEKGMDIFEESVRKVSFNSY
ncbi:MAG: aminotransferase class III-fold pyridoxal phosphate-dependent enzyme [Candidatus Aenigmarchaeota archaeon]|nr:aminotransferase class III-fold pyridoxal phosphate-dependent enzyme [Candidatus Aenigmarchaeota archaeon]